MQEGRNKTIVLEVKQKCQEEYDAENAMQRKTNWKQQKGSTWCVHQANIMKLEDHKGSICVYK